MQKKKKINTINKMFAHSNKTTIVYIIDFVDKMLTTEN